MDRRNIEMENKAIRFFKKFWFKISFIVLGTVSLIWFLVRVIPKPSRATYPCMKVAAPFASSFVSYLLGITTFALFLKKARQQIQKSKYVVAVAFLFGGLAAGVWAITHTEMKAEAAPTLASPQEVNAPIGEAKGIFPGRVVWTHNPDATNENCSNSNNDWWYFDDNTDLEVVRSMVSSSIQKVAGASTDSEAWNKIFKYYNSTHGRGDVGYTPGEKFAIKINLNGQNGKWPRDGNINTSPQLCYAVIDQLVNVVGVAQSDIGIGDPNFDMADDWYDMLHADFPDVEYWGRGSGQTMVTKSAEPVVYYSDGSVTDHLPQEYIDATYMLNLPVLKKHHRSGISIFCKNHFGSVTPFTDGAWHLHYSLPSPDATGVDVNGDYGSYRCFVDIMGHKDLGGKTLLFIVDGIWASINWGHPPVKWAMPPFNNDWPSTLFVSLDPVAVESVCYDFLYYEFDENHPTEGVFVGDDKGPFPHFSGTDDYLHQAADPDNWPASILYDPEDDGSVLKSMGTHEHWNNAIDKQYTRNLSNEGAGIELYKNFVTSSRQLKLTSGLNTCSNFPNPVKNSTFFKLWIEQPSNVSLSVTNMKGQTVYSANLGRLETGSHQHQWNTMELNGLPAPAGIYTYAFIIKNNDGYFRVSNKLSVVR
ncbi:MAG: DUF362 domain-containing protein [Prolixibacteraceae bacterium]|nr:DUF362 domain-containing protein [Prolixibacteraceae bacterium]